eukprot:scaffold13929_cov16-Prasinocladus_malaysianus.AAC.3
MVFFSLLSCTRRRFTELLSFNAGDCQQHGFDGAGRLRLPAVHARVCSGQGRPGGRLRAEGQGERDPQGEPPEESLHRLAKVR